MRTMPPAVLVQTPPICLAMMRCRSKGLALVMSLLLLLLVPISVSGFAPLSKPPGSFITGNTREAIYPFFRGHAYSGGSFKNHNRVFATGSAKIIRSTKVATRVVVLEMAGPTTDGAAALRSVTFCNVPKDQEPELLCELLMEVGACSTAIIDADRGTSLEQSLFGEPGYSANGQSGRFHLNNDSDQSVAPIWNRCNVTAHFPTSVDLKRVVELIADVFPEQHPLDPQSLQVEQVPNRDWVIHVQQSWKPITIGPYVLRFPWHTKDDIQNAIKLNDNGNDQEDRFELKLQGGIAFGTGEHPTTQLCLEWLHSQVKELLSSSSCQQQKPTQQQTSLLYQEEDMITIMDYGAGSGILGMAACALDPKRVKAVGVDIDVDAIQIANENAVANNLPMKSYLPPLVETADNESKSLLMKAHAHARKQLSDRGHNLSGSTGDNDDNSNNNNNNNNNNETLDIILPDHLGLPTYDIGVANILAGPLVALSSTIAGLIRPGGRLAMSGILPQQAEMVIEAYAEYFDNVQVERELGGWILITGTRQ